MKPRIPITNPAFIYVNSASTDISKRFEAELKRIAEAKKPEKKLIPFDRLKR